MQSYAALAGVPHPSRVLTPRGSSPCTQTGWPWCLFMFQPHSHSSSSCFHKERFPTSLLVIHHYTSTPSLFTEEQLTWNRTHKIRHVAGFSQDDTTEKVVFREYKCCSLSINQCIINMKTEISKFPLEKQPINYGMIT